MTFVKPDSADLRRRGEYGAADVLDNMPPLSPPLPSQPAAMVVQDREGREDRSSGSGSAGSSRSAPTEAAPAGAESGPSMGGGAGPAGGAGEASSGEHAGGAAPGAGSGAGQEQPADPHPTPEPHVHQPDLHDDPLAGLHSERLRDRLQRDAFSTASQTAQDSAISHRADQLSRRYDPAVNNTLELPALDVSPATRQASWAALGGAVPGWVKGDPVYDPALIRAAERNAEVLRSSTVTLRDVEPVRGVDRVAEQAHALRAQTPVHAFAAEAVRVPSQHSAPSRRESSSDEGRER